VDKISVLVVDAENVVRHAEEPCAVAENGSRCIGRAKLKRRNAEGEAESDASA